MLHTGERADSRQLNLAQLAEEHSQGPCAGVAKESKYLEARPCNGGVNSGDETSLLCCHIACCLSALHYSGHIRRDVDGEALMPWLGYLRLQARYERSL